MKDKFVKILYVLLVVLLLELISFFIFVNYKRDKIVKEYEVKIKIEHFNQEKEKKKLFDEFEMNKYLASGKNAYERIFNNREKDIVNLIREISVEALPPSWKSEVRTEEFINFILLIQPPFNIEEPTTEVVKYLIPILVYSDGYLKNIAVFNKKHQSYLYFDEDALNELLKTKTLSTKTVDDIKNKGVIFTRYNAVKIDYEEKSGHIFIPVIVSGKYGSYECIMMLDTGASMTVISLELAQKTGHEDLDNTQRKTFSTANGTMVCPIVEREVIVGSLDKKQSVAVNTQDTTNLLGVDFFESKGYIIDTESKSIYVWSK